MFCVRGLLRAYWAVSPPIRLGVPDTGDVSICAPPVDALKNLAALLKTSETARAVRDEMVRLAQSKSSLFQRGPFAGNLITLAAAAAAQLEEAPSPAASDAAATEKAGNDLVSDRSLLIEGCVMVAQHSKPNTMDLLTLIQCTYAIHVVCVNARGLVQSFLKSVHVITAQRGLSRSSYDPTLRVACASVVLAITPPDLSGKAFRGCYMDPALTLISIIGGEKTSQQSGGSTSNRFILSARALQGLSFLLTSRTLTQPIATQISIALLSDRAAIRHVLLTDKPAISVLTFFLRQVKKQAGTAASLALVAEEIVDVYGIGPELCMLSFCLVPGCPTHRRLVEFVQSSDVSKLSAMDCFNMQFALPQEATYASACQRLYARCAEDSAGCTVQQAIAILFAINFWCRDGDMTFAKECEAVIGKLLEIIKGNLEFVKALKLRQLLEMKFIKELYPSFFDEIAKRAVERNAFIVVSTGTLRNFIKHPNLKDSPLLVQRLLAQYLRTHKMTALAAFIKQIASACLANPPTEFHAEFLSFAQAILTYRSDSTHPLVASPVNVESVGERLVCLTELCDACQLQAEQIRQNTVIHQLFIGLFSQVRRVTNPSGSDEASPSTTRAAPAPTDDAAGDDSVAAEESPSSEHIKEDLQFATLSNIDAVVTWFLKKSLRLPSESSIALTAALSIPNEHRHSLLIAALQMPSVPTPPELDPREILRAEFSSCPVELLPVAFRTVCEPSYLPEDVVPALTAILGKADGNPAFSSTVETLLRLLLVRWLHDRSSGAKREFAPEVLPLFCSALSIVSPQAIRTFCAAFMHVLPKPLQLFLWQAVKDTNLDSLETSTALVIACTVDESAELLMPRILAKKDQISAESLLKVTLHCPNSPSVCALLCDRDVSSRLPAIFCARILAAVGFGAPVAALQALADQLLANDAIDSLGDDDWSFLVIALDRHLASASTELPADAEQSPRQVFAKLFTQSLRLSTITDPPSLQNFLTFFPSAAAPRALVPFCEDLRSRILVVVADADVNRFIRLVHEMKRSCFNGPDLMGTIFEHYMSQQSQSCLPLEKYEAGLTLVKMIINGIVEPQPLHPESLQLFTAWALQVTTGDPLTRSARLLDALNVLVDAKCSGSWCESLVSNLLAGVDELSPSDFSRLVQQVSRIKGFSDNTRFALRSAFSRFHIQSDAHSRATLFKALSSDSELFAEFQEELIGGAQENVDVLGPDDIESIFVSLMGCAASPAVEMLVDSLCTRLLQCFAQARRSTLVRAVQCMAHFHLSDAELVPRIVSAFEDQREIVGKLDAVQVLTLLKALSDLHARMSERLVVSCFFRLEQQVESMTTVQVVTALELALTLEMAFVSSVAQLLNRAYENRDTIRGSEALSRTLEAFCEEYSADVPQTASVAFLRKKWSKQRQSTLYARQAEARRAS